MEDELYDELTDILVIVARPHHVADTLSPWEVRFCQDLRQRHDRWGKQIQLTEKQWTVLRRIKEKCDEAD